MLRLVCLHECSAEEPHKLMFCVDDFNLYSAVHILLIEAPAYCRKCTLTRLHAQAHHNSTRVYIIMKRDEEVNSDDDGDDDMMVLTLPRLLLPVLSRLLSVWHGCKPRWLLCFGIPYDVYSVGTVVMCTGTFPVFTCNICVHCISPYDTSLHSW